MFVELSRQCNCRKYLEFYNRCKDVFSQISIEPLAFQFIWDCCSSNCSKQVTILYQGCPLKISLSQAFASLLLLKRGRALNRAEMNVSTTNQISFFTLVVYSIRIFRFYPESEILSKEGLGKYSEEY